MQHSCRELHAKLILSSLLRRGVGRHVKPISSTNSQATRLSSNRDVTRIS